MTRTMKPSLLHILRLPVMIIKRSTSPYTHNGRQQFPARPHVIVSLSNCATTRQGYGPKLQERKKICVHFFLFSISVYRSRYLSAFIYLLRWKFCNYSPVLWTKIARKKKKVSLFPSPSIDLDIYQHLSIYCVEEMKLEGGCYETKSQ